jgi:hypothetical protein
VIEQNKGEVCVLQQPFTACARGEFDRNRKKQSLAASHPKPAPETEKKPPAWVLYNLIKKATVTDRQAQTAFCLSEALTTCAFALCGRAGLFGFNN